MEHKIRELLQLLVKKVPQVMKILAEPSI